MVYSVVLSVNAIVDSRNTTTVIPFSGVCLIVTNADYNEPGTPLHRLSPTITNTLGLPKS